MGKIRLFCNRCILARCRRLLTRLNDRACSAARMLVPRTVVIGPVLDHGVEGEREKVESGFWLIEKHNKKDSINTNGDVFRTYGHRLSKTRLPVRSAKDKPQID